MKTSYCLIAFVVLFIACKKEMNSASRNTSVLQDGSADNLSAATYLPLTKNTYWKYSVTTKPDKPQSSKLKVTGENETINKKNYQSIKSVLDGETDTIYYSQDKHDYYIYTNTGMSEDDHVSLEILFLKDDAAVGTTWLNAAGTADGFNLKCYGKIIAKNITLTVSGVEYKHVIHTYIEIRKPLFFFTYIVVNKQDFYVAENIGIIKNISNTLLPINSTTKTLITGYSIQ